MLVDRQADDRQPYSKPAGLQRKSKGHRCPRLGFPSREPQGGCFKRGAGSISRPWASVSECLACRSVAWRPWFSWRNLEEASNCSLPFSQRCKICEELKIVDTRRAPPCSLSISISISHSHSLSLLPSPFSLLVVFCFPYLHRA
jgi:hypothetical protein